MRKINIIGRAVYFSLGFVAVAAIVFLAPLV